MIHVKLVVLLLLAGFQEGMPPYDRSEWGRWMPTGQYGPNGCRWDSRHTALRNAAATDRQTLVVRDLPGKACRVVSLSFVDRYTGEVFTGPGNKIDIDHLVPLAEAHRSGGWKWTPETKLAFFNDPLNHVPTHEKVNASKSDRDPGGESQRGGIRPWWPIDPTARCPFAERWILVKRTWGLFFDPRERDALASTLESCAELGPDGKRFLLDYELLRAAELIRRDSGLSPEDVGAIRRALYKLGPLLHSIQSSEQDPHQ